jgi:uncharacterized protein with PIN domain
MEMNANAPRLAADRMLARLARWLRLCGVDITFDKMVGGAELLRTARQDRRFVLTRDKRLRTAPDALYLTSERVPEQLREVLHRFAIDPTRTAFTRCARCNSLLREVSRETVRGQVPPYVYATQERFSQCADCGRIFWRATHTERIKAALSHLAS